MDDQSLNRAFFNGWILTAVCLLFIVAFSAFVFVTNTPGPEVEWDMGGTPFVPASGEEANGYDLPAPTEGTP